MEFNFLVDECYLSSLFLDINKNLEEIEWYTNLNSHIPSTMGNIFITKDLLSKKFNEIDNAEIFYPSSGKSRDLALRFILAQQKYFKKYLAREIDEEVRNTELDFPTFIEKNRNIILLTKNSDTPETGLSRNDITTLTYGEQALDRVRVLVSQCIDILDTEFREIASILFPSIYIHWSNKVKFENFDVGQNPIKWVVESLSFLNDHAVIIFRKNPSLFIDEALKFGLEISPESTKTRKTSRLMKEREIVIESESINCEWHFKFHKTEGGRIHFHFGYDVSDKTKVITSGFPIVGIFAHHLNIA